MSLFHSVVHNIPDLRMSLKELTRKILREIECAESVTNNQKEWEMQEEIILMGQEIDGLRKLIEDLSTENETLRMQNENLRMWVSDLRIDEVIGIK